MAPKCPYCEKEVEIGTNDCPFCAAPILLIVKSSVSQTIVKRIGLVILILTSGFFILCVPMLLFSVLVGFFPSSSGSSSAMGSILLIWTYLLAMFAFLISVGWYLYSIGRGNCRRGNLLYLIASLTFILSVHIYSFFSGHGWRAPFAIFNFLGMFMFKI
jgi:hypothetical protein